MCHVNYSLFNMYSGLESSKITELDHQVQRSIEQYRFATRVLTKTWNLKHCWSVVVRSLAQLSLPCLLLNTIGHTSKMPTSISNSLQSSLRQEWLNRFRKQIFKITEHIYLYSRNYQYFMTRYCQTLRRRIPRDDDRCNVILHTEKN